MIHFFYENIINTLLVLSLIILIAVLAIRKAYAFYLDSEQHKTKLQNRLNEIDDYYNDIYKNNHIRSEKITARIAQTHNFILALIKMCSKYDSEYWQVIYITPDESAFTWLFDKLPSFHEICHSNRPITLSEWISPDDLVRLQSKYVKPKPEKTKKNNLPEKISSKPL